MRRMMALAELLPDVDVPRDIVVRGLTWTVAACSRATPSWPLRDSVRTG